MKHIVAIMLLLTWTAAACAARPRDSDKELRSAEALLGAGNYPAAYARYQRAAIHNPVAQFMLGLFHKNGWGRTQDPIAACTWFDKAAHQKVPTAQHLWGDCLAQGIGRPANIPEALAWYDQAASGGHLISLCSEAEYIIAGRGIAKDAARGLELCVRAAQANSPPAMLKVAGYYQNNPEVPQDLAAARYWYEQAAQRHVPEAQFRFGLMLANGEGGPADSEAARFWLESAAADGYVPAYLPTAVMYANLPVQADTGALAPEHLAKIYLWSAAARARSATSEQTAAADKLLAQTLSVMPPGWRSGLDNQVTQHLKKFAH